MKSFAIGIAVKSYLIATVFALGIAWALLLWTTAGPIKLLGGRASRNLLSPTRLQHDRKRAIHVQTRLCSGRPDDAASEC